jgi:hypothetical protein
VAKGKWALGLEPKYFTWIIKEQLAISERPGGLARNHRKVRRTEELSWIAQHGFTKVISLLDTPHNLTAYTEANISSENLPLGKPDEYKMTLPPIYVTLGALLANPTQKVLLHQEEYGDLLFGVVGGFLWYCGIMTTDIEVVQTVEKVVNRSLGVDARRIIAYSVENNLRRDAQ